MWKYFVISILIFSLFQDGVAQINTESYLVEKKFPTYETIVNLFFSTYSLKDFNFNTGSISFARKPSGWYVEFENTYSKDFTYREMFWDLSSQSWRQLNLPIISIDSVFKNNSYLNEYLKDTVFYNLNLFYGYKGWQGDVIHFVNPNGENLDVRNIYFLGRAYSSLATYTIWPRITFYNEYLKYDSTFNSEDIPLETVKTFIRYSDSSIFYYGLILKKDKTFETYVGNINDDFSNEHVKAYTFLSILGKQDLGSKYINGGIYDSFSLNYYRNILQSCDSNAILISGGDNDSYRLIFLQARFNVRNDVTVVLKPLLSDGRYLHYLSKNIVFNSSKAPFFLTDEQYKLDHNDFFFYDTNNSYRSVSDFLYSVTAAKKLANLNNLDTIKNGQLRLEFNYIERDAVDQGNKRDALGFTNRFEWNVSFQGYITKEELAFIDLLATNSFERPIFFCYNKDASFVFGGIDDYLADYGLFFKLVPNVVHNKGLRKIINERKCLNLMKKYSFSGLDSNLKTNNNIKELIQNYKYAFYSLIAYFMAQGKLKPSVKLLNKYFTTFPNEVFPFDNDTYFLIELYYKLDKFEKGDKLMSILAIAVQRKLFQEIEYNKFNHQEIVKCIGTINEILDATRNYHRPLSLNNEIDKIRKSMVDAYNKF